MDIKVMEETAQVKFQSNQGVIATFADSFVLHGLRAH